MQKSGRLPNVPPFHPFPPSANPALGREGEKKGGGPPAKRGWTLLPSPHLLGHGDTRSVVVVVVVAGVGGGRGVEWGSYARRRRCHRETRGGAEKIGAASEKAAKAAGERKDPSPRGRNLGGRRRRRLRLHFPKKKNPLLPPPPPSIFFPSKSEGRKETSGCRRFGFGPKKGRGGHWSQ